MYRSIASAVALGLLASACSLQGSATNAAPASTATFSDSDGVRTLGNLSTVSGPGDDGSLATAGGSNQAARPF